MATSTFELIGDVTLGSNGAIDITGIPATYTDLIIKGHLRAAGGSSVVENCFYYFNNDQSAIYSDMRMIGYGNSPGVWVQNSDWGLTSNYIGAIQGAAPVLTAAYTPFEIKVAQYANTSRWKFTIGAWGTYTYEAGYRSGNYKSNNAINRFTMGCGGGSGFAAGSSVTIWGIKAE
jgi:hypothetical protein